MGPDGSVRVALLGLGTIGSGVYELMRGRPEHIARECGFPIVLHKVLELSADRLRELAVPYGVPAADFQEILDDESIDIIVELIGGLEPAGEWAKASLAAGKVFVTANKELLAKRGKEIFDASQEHGVEVLFEASVGGGIPIIRPLKESLAANRFSRVTGIVNGTTNYVLTRMAEAGLSFADALTEAKKKGFAEADPTNDVEGFDAAAKIAILSSIAFHSRVTFDEVSVEGISRITKSDIRYADETGYVLKLLAIGEERDGRISARVHPAMLKREHPLASVRNEFNAVFVEGDAVGEVMFYGPGAGKMPTASAVLGDVVEAARNVRAGMKMKLGCSCFEEKGILPTEELRSKFYLLLRAVDKPGVLARVASIFGEHGVSIESVLQTSRGEVADLVFIMHEVLEKDFFLSLKEIAKQDVVAEVASCIRVIES